MNIEGGSFYTKKLVSKLDNELSYTKVLVFKESYAR